MMLRIKRISVILFLLVGIFSSVYSFSLGLNENKDLEEEYRQFVPEEYSRDWTNAEISYSFYYEGSEVPPAQIYLYSNGVMIWERRFSYEEELENIFYLYEIDGDRIKVKVVDKRVDIGRYVEVALYHLRDESRDVISVNVEDNSAIYGFGDTLFFGGFYFFLEE
ncbi:hypothetical protein S1OALGB6SA_1507 [Olavius algarvensis spirochete endosymbiont]|uniref:hypothetical protein n=1 Tax=Olavius algarvensis spirochete endosymbiont TaxID=260710 RepID=UPI000F2779D5|nr:hypothetical protein [Olavius algarvensis spirochete endosymbiont]CAD7843836.1 MAG: hypothetical protein [Olavius algarvensis spirochete endosymbiont]VDB00425.1 hypothetical protein S1OALGB6SA_1507 [Olavius algarvensis spirochete endosymbiont]